MAQTPNIDIRNFVGKNRIINGDMRIDQRNAGAAVVITTKAFPVDRFFSIQNTGTGTMTGVKSTLAGSSSFLLTATSAVTDLTTTKLMYGIGQEIEAQNIFDLNNKSISISFKVQTNWSGNLSIALSNSNYSRSYVTNVAVVSGINNVSLVVPLESNTILTNNNAYGMSLIIGFNNEATYRTATTGSWIAGDFRVATTSTQWAKTTGNFINVTEVQLEQGNVATPFERVPISMQLQQCQRYYEKSYDLDLAPASASGAGQVLFTSANPNSGGTVLSFQFKTHKRATPTVSVYSPTTGAVNAMRNNSGSVDVLAGPSSIGVAGAAASNGATTTSGNVHAFHWTANAEL